jgi:histidinol-phosphate aminotransferase
VLSEATLLAVLENPTYIRERVEKVVQERERLFTVLRGMDKVDVRASRTNFLVFRTPLSSNQMVERMAAEGVLIRNVGGYALLNDFVRVTVGTEPENQAFLVALKNVLEDA